jgi:diacylglycerol kinase (ATP)
MRDAGKRFRLQGRVWSFKYALAGIRILLKSQRNARIHACATVAVCAAGLFLGLSSAEWCWVVLAIVAVWTAEALNTAFESLANVASPDFHPAVKTAKDVAAGAVLISAMGSVIIGLLVFGPHLMALVR